jgi:hypothetical protein
VLKEYDCGVVSKDFTLASMAMELNRLTTEKIWYYKQQAHKAAKSLCAENNREFLLDLVKNLIQ